MNATKSNRSFAGVAAIAVLLGGGVLAWWLTRPEGSTEAEAPAAVPTLESRATALPEPAASPPTPEDRWRAKRDQLRAAWKRRPAPSDEAEPEAVGRCTRDCWGSLKLQLKLAGSIEGCRELLPPEAQGQARFSAKVLAEPGLGAVVDSVEVLEDTIEVEAFRECIIESAPLAELADTTEPVSDQFVFRYSAGTPRNNAVDFLGDHPELVERFPELAAMVERSGDGPPRDGDATTFAQILSTDEAAMSAFSEWMVEQGVDLSQVRPREP